MLAKRTVLVLPQAQTDAAMTEVRRDQAITLAMRATESEHEHTWTPEEQVLLAKYVLWAAQRLYLCERTAAGDPMVPMP